MKATKILNGLFGTVAVLSCAFSLIYGWQVVAALISAGDVFWVLAMVNVVVTLYHFIVLGVLAIPFVVACILAKKNHENILYFIITYSLAVLLNGGLLLISYLA